MRTAALIASFALTIPVTLTYGPGWGSSCQLISVAALLSGGHKP